MIVTVTQTASNVKQAYHVQCEGFSFQGRTGRFHSQQPIFLSGKNGEIKGVHRRSTWYNYIPLRYMAGGANLTRRFDFFHDDQPYGSVSFSKHGMLRSFYVITMKDGTIFTCYSCAKGEFDYVAVYGENGQVALIETYLSTNDYKYTHKLYLLQEYDRYVDALSFFVLYYANYHFSKRFHMSKGSTYTRAWSVSYYNDKHDPQWRKQHFPHENFWGRIHLSDS